MTILTGIRPVGDQRLRTRDEFGNLITIDLRFLPAVQQWVADITSGNFTVTSIRLANSPNLLYQYQRIIPFGMAIIVSDGGEPFLINDFSTARAEIAILTQTEVAQINAAYARLK